MNILITGGSRGIGRATALQMSQDKDNQIIITGRNEKGLRETAAMATYGNISWYTIDLSNLSVESAAFREHVASEFSILDILINNAGSFISKKFAELTDNEIRGLMESNYFSPFSLIRLLLPLMSRGSHIVNISSMGGFQGSVKFQGLSAYSASKAALICLTECLALELAENGISINCLAPGSVQTEMLDEAFPGYKAQVTANEIARFISDFAVSGNRLFNGKILPVALTTP